MKNSSPKLIVKKRIKLKNSIKDVIDLKNGIFICSSNINSMNDYCISIKNIYTNKILFDQNFDNNKIMSVRHILNKDKTSIYIVLEVVKENEYGDSLPFDTFIYNISTKTYQLELVYEKILEPIDKKREFYFTNIYEMNNQKILAMKYLEKIGEDENKNNISQNHINVIDLKTKRIIKDTRFDMGFPDLDASQDTRNLIFTKDDKYVVTKEWKKLQIHSMETGNLVYERKEDSIMEFNTIQLTDFVFTKDNKYLLFGVEKNFSGNDDNIFTANNEKLFKLLWVIDFETKDFCYELAEKYIGSQLYQDHDKYSSNYGYCSAKNLTISNDGKYAFLYTDEKYTIPFEIATGEILYLPNWCRFFFDEKYPNHVGMYYESINEYVLAEIEYKDLY